MNEENENKTSFLEKLKSIFKKNPALSGTVVTVSLYTLGIFVLCIIIVAVMYSIIAAFSTLFGIKEEKFTSGDYKDKTLTELQDTDFKSCYANMNENGWQAFWQEFGDKITGGIQSECEFLALVNKKIDKYEKEYSKFGLELNPGLIISTIIYSYSSQPREEGKEAVDPGQPMKVLKAIIDDKIFDESDIDDMLENMVLREAFWYYNCEEVSCYLDGSNVIENAENEEREIKKGKQCVRNFYFNIKFSRQKFYVYLRYGVEAALYYEAALSHNKSLNYICDECYQKWNEDEYNYYTIGVDTYLSVANVNTDTADNIVISLNETEKAIIEKETKEAARVAPRLYNLSTKITFEKTEYTYKDGFMYNKFPNFKPAFDSGKITEREIYVPKTIEKSITSMESYERTLNNVLGIEEINENNNGNPDMFVKGPEVRGRVCPTEEECDCNNGNGRPSGGGITSGDGDSNFDIYNNSQACDILATATTKRNIRLVTCPGETDYNTRLPGGGTFYKNGTIHSSTGAQYKAKELITWKEYLIGLSISEIYASSPVEALKFQMLIGQSYALNRLFDNSSGFYFNSAGELEIVVGECVQSFHYDRYQSSYESGKYSTKLDEAYSAVGQQLLVNSGSNQVVQARYGSSLQTKFIGLANSGKSYTDILSSDVVRNYTGGYYKNAEIKSCSEIGNTNVPSSSDLPTSTNSNISQLALSYVGKDTGRDCSGFVRIVLRKLGYTSTFSSGRCGGESRGSYGMYLDMVKNNRIVWKRSSGISLSASMSTFPGNCSSGDLLFYTQGNNDCVRHVGVYIGNINGKHMIADTTIANHVAQYREVDSLSNNWIPLACARAY